MKDILVLSGCGPRSAITLGAIKYLWDVGGLEKYKTIVAPGSSSFIAILLACSYTPDEIFNALYSSNPLYKSGPSINIILNIIQKLSLNKMSEFAAPIERLIKDRVKECPTLKQIYDATGYEIYIPVANLTTSDIEFFSYKSTPNLSCIDAIRLACSIPYVFEPLTFKNQNYSSCEISSAFPIDFYRIINASEINKILAINVSGEIFASDEKATLLDHILHFSIRKKQRDDLNRAIKKLGDKLILVDYNLKPFNITTVISNKNENKSMYSYGYKFIKQMLGGVVYRDDDIIQEVDTLPNPVFPSFSAVTTTTTTTTLQAPPSPSTKNHE